MEDKRKGNQFWKLRSKNGPDFIFSSPDVLREECHQYFEFIDDNPLMEERLLSNGKKVDVSKMRAYTLEGLCYFLKITTNTWRNYRDRPDFKDVTEEIEQVIYDQKFTGAASGLLNANLISRDLGLVDRQEQKIVTDKPKDFSQLSDEELKQYELLESKLTTPLLTEGPIHTLPLIEAEIIKEDRDEQ